MARGRNRKDRPKDRPWLRILANGVARWYYPAALAQGQSEAVRRRDGSFVDGAEAEKEAQQLTYERLCRQQAPQKGEENQLLIVFDLYLAHLRDKKATVKTIQEYSGFFQSFEDRWPALTVQELKATHVKTWMNEHPSWGPSYRNMMGTALKAALNWASGAESGQIIPTNPLRGLRLPSVRSRGAKSLISLAEHQKMMEAVPEDLGGILAVLWETGTRPNNVWRAEARNLDVSQQALIYAEWNTDEENPAHKTAKKTGRPLVIPLTPPAFTILQTLAQKYPEGRLFRTHSGELWDAERLANRIRWYAKRLDLKHITAYGYRHSVATDLLEKGVPDAEVAAILGHTGTAMIYRHYSHLGARIKRLRETLSRHRGEETATPLEEQQMHDGEV